MSRQSVSHLVSQLLGKKIFSSKISYPNYNRVSSCSGLFLQHRDNSNLIQPFEPELYDGKRNEQSAPEHFRFVYPDFLPDPKYEVRNLLREKLEREDMIARRMVMEIPEFYTGSILSVTVSDPNASGKKSRFVGICIDRGGYGLRSWFTLRNVVDRSGVEIMYEMYCPLIQRIDVLRLEKRLDERLTYLRDCLPEYSTFPFDMEPDPLPEGAPVPVNPLKVRLKPRPWRERWERQDLIGVEEFPLPLQFSVKAKLREQPWEKYDLMKEYRSTIPEEEQNKIYAELAPHMPKLEEGRRRVMRIRAQKRKE